MTASLPPRPPYYAAIFASRRSSADPTGYAEAAKQMEALASQQPGFLGITSVREADGHGVTVSYWADLAALRAWGRDAAHLDVQAKGRTIWYEEFRLEICRVESSHVFNKANAGPGLMDFELISQYERLPATYRRAVNGLSTDELRAKPGPGAWSIQELVVHVVDTDFVITDRMKRVIAEDKPPLIAFAENLWLERLATDEQSLADSLTLFEVNHRQFARVLKTLTNDAWSRIGIHTEAGELKLSDLFKKSISHAEHHLKFLLGKRETLGKPAPSETGQAWGSAT